MKCTFRKVVIAVAEMDLLCVLLFDKVNAI